MTCRKLVARHGVTLPSRGRRDGMLASDGEGMDHAAELDSITTEIGADAEEMARWQPLILQAHAISLKAFDKPFCIEGLAGYRHLTLITDAAKSKALGYCLYYMARNDGIQGKEWMLWIEQLAVSEEWRGRGFGKRLLEWAIARARSAECDSVRLTSVHRAYDFYVSQGFAAEVCAGDNLCRLIKKLKRVNVGTPPMMFWNEWQAAARLTAAVPHGGGSGSGMTVLRDGGCAVVTPRALGSGPLSNAAPWQHLRPHKSG